MTYEDKKRIRVLLPADQLREMMARHPEIEIELLHSVIPQVAESIRRNATNDVINDINQRVSEHFRYPASLPANVIAAIDNAIKVRITEKILQDARLAAEARIGKQVDEWFKKHEPRINEIIAARIAHLVNAVTQLKTSLGVK